MKRSAHTQTGTLFSRVIARPRQELHRAAADAVSELARDRDEGVQRRELPEEDGDRRAGRGYFDYGSNSFTSL